MSSTPSLDSLKLILKLLRFLHKADLIKIWPLTCRIQLFPISHHLSGLVWNPAIRDIWMKLTRLYYKGPARQHFDTPIHVILLYRNTFDQMTTISQLHTYMVHKSCFQKQNLASITTSALVCIAPLSSPIANSLLLILRAFIPGSKQRPH